MFENDPVEDLDKLVTELRLDARRPPDEDTADDGRLLQWLKRVRELGGADLLLVAGAPATIRARGSFVAASTLPLDPTHILQAVAPLLPTRLLERHRAGESVDLAFSRPGLGRFRMNLH
jgi:Tfp pilus assembly pilus retraction ATPase PilT